MPTTAPTPTLAERLGALSSEMNALRKEQADAALALVNDPAFADSLEKLKALRDPNGNGSIDSAVNNVVVTIENLKVQARVIANPVPPYVPPTTVQPAES